MSRSPTNTRPEESRTTPVRAFISVDFPDPFGPTTEATVRGATEIDTPWMMSPAPYPARISCARSAGRGDDPRAPLAQPTRYASTTSVRDRKAAIVPVASTVPSAITITGSQNSSMMASSCSTMRMVIPSAHRPSSWVPI